MKDLALKLVVLTLFPDMWPGPLGFSLIGKALKSGIWTCDTIDIRDFACDKHKSVDFPPYGGGAGMVMRPDVVADAIDFAKADISNHPLYKSCEVPVFSLSPRGVPLSQEVVKDIAENDSIIVICGRFEGIDQRVLDSRNVKEISLGDFIMTGGDIGAMSMVDAVVRLRPGVLGNADSIVEESFSSGLLEHNHYTKPMIWEDKSVPEVLRSGHHEKIALHRIKEAENLTKDRRPDLWEKHCSLKR